VFAAFGFGAPIRWRLGIATVAAVAAAASVTVEVLQHALSLGRVSSIDDVVLNTAGAVLAACAGKRWARKRPAPAGGLPVSCADDDFRR
jgi:glycopeptide antibiotics resistance protein